MKNKIITDEEKLRRLKIIALDLMKEYDLINNGWKFEYSDALRFYGFCNYTTKIISLSKNLVLLNNEKHNINTIKHEIAHALTKGHHHDKTWRKMALLIGCDGLRCYSDEVVTPKHKYKLSCGNCGEITFRHRKRKGLACGNCCNKYNNKTYTPKFKFKISKNI